MGVFIALVPMALWSLLAVTVGAAGVHISGVAENLYDGLYGGPVEFEPTTYGIKVLPHSGWPV